MASPRVRKMIAAAATILVTALAAACSAPETSPPAASTSVPATSPSATVSTVDKSMSMDEKRRAAIDAAAAEFLAKSRDETPGLWLAVWDPRYGYYEQAYGDAVAGRTKATVSDHNYIGSVTKTALATAVLQQVATGSMALTSAVDELDPELAATYPSIAKVTVADLLGMQSGIPSFGDPMLEILMKNPKASFTRDELIALAMESSAVRPSSATRIYSDTNYLILGRLIQAVTGNAPEDEVNAVFAQAGMRESGLPTQGGLVPEPRGHGHAGPLDIGYLTDHGASLDPDGDVSGWSMDGFKENGGAYATIGDLATWGGTCMGDSLLPDDLVAARVIARPIDIGQYGLGVFVDGTWLSHAGVVPGWNVRVACNPDTGAVVALMANSWDAFDDMDRTLAESVYPDYYAAMRGT